MGARFISDSSFRCIDRLSGPPEPQRSRIALRRVRRRARSATALRSPESSTLKCQRFRKTRRNFAKGNRSYDVPDSKWSFQQLLIRSKQGDTPQSCGIGDGGCLVGSRLLSGGRMWIEITGSQAAPFRFQCV